MDFIFRKERYRKMTEEERRNLGRFGYQPREEHRGYQPTESNPQKAESASNVVKSNGNVEQEK